MKVLLTNPPWWVDNSWGVRAGSRWPFSHAAPGYLPYPHFLGYTTSFLLKNGIGAKFYDAIALMHGYEQFYKEVKDYKPDIIVVETSTPSINHDLEVIKKLKNLTNAEIVLVGTHATVFAEDLIKLPEIDYVVKGDYEKQVLEICKTRNKKIYDYDFISLDLLPFPYMDSSYVSRYFDGINSKTVSTVKKPQLQIYPSRGCHKRCKFCQWVSVLYKHKIRFMSVNRVLSEIEDRISKFGIKDVFVDSDSFGYGGEKWLLEFIDGMKKFKIQYSILTTEGLIPKELYPLFKESGCYCVRFGVETFSQRLYDTIGKGGKVEDIENLIKYLLELGFYVHFTTMIYIPGETEEDRQILNRKIAELASHPKCGYQQSFCVPFPGTEYFNMYRERGFGFIYDWESYDGNPGNSKTRDFLEKLKKYAIK